MAAALQTGSILIEEGTLLPELLRLEREPFSNGWTSVKNLDSVGLGKEIQKAGWTFFYMAGEIKATVFGFNAERMVRTAVKRVIANVTSQGCNCLEITRVQTKSFLGIPYVSVTAHSRHIQESLSFSRDRAIAWRDAGVPLDALRPESDAVGAWQGESVESVSTK